MLLISVVQAYTGVQGDPVAVDVAATTLEVISETFPPVEGLLDDLSVFNFFKRAVK